MIKSATVPLEIASRLLVPPDALKLAAAALLLAPQTPLLFMGEEYGETAPFLYFIDHGDPGLVEAVRKGRRREFAAFGWKEVPDPQDPATFDRSRVHPGMPKDDGQAALFRWYAELIRLRKTIPALGAADSDTHGIRVWIYPNERVLVVHRWAQQGPEALLLLGFNDKPTTITLREPKGRWSLRLDSRHTSFGGTDHTSSPGPSMILPDGVQVSLPAYAALLYLTTA